MFLLKMNFDGTTKQKSSNFFKMSIVRGGFFEILLILRTLVLTIIFIQGGAGYQN